MIKEFFKKHYKKIMIVPLLLLVVSLVFLTYKYSTTGELFNRDVSLKGGISATVYTQKGINTLDLENKLSSELNTKVTVTRISDFVTKTSSGYVIEAGDVSIEDNLKLKLEEILETPLNDTNYNVSLTGSSLGENFYKDLLKAMIFAFVLMAIVIFFVFRSFIPSVTVIFSVLLDISATLMITNLLGITISIAGIAAFLLIIGYSVDTDVLMTNKVIKRKDEGELLERMYESAKTGMTMTVTTFVALTLGYLASSSLILKEIFIIILIALVIDVISSYAMNAGVLYWYFEGRKNEARR